MAKIQVNRLTNANIYLDGANLLGRAEEVKLPEVTAKMAEHKGLGLVGMAEFPSGIDKLEATIKWASLYPEVMRKAGNPFRAVQLQVRASLDEYASQGRIGETPVICHLTGTFKKFPMGSFKQHENAEYETTLSITYVKLIVGVDEILELDVLANIYKVGGEDILATYRRNIGG